jgi:hypothetical protein
MEARHWLGGLPVSYDYNVVLTRKDGSVRNFRIYGQPLPNGGEIISLPVHGRVIKARVNEPSQESGMDQSVGRADVIEV